MHYISGMLNREKLLNVRCTEHEIRMVKALADHRGLSISDAVRQMIREAFSQDFDQGTLRGAAVRRGKGT